MLTSFKIHNNTLTQTKGNVDGLHSAQIIWIHLVAPSDDEIRITEDISGFALPQIKETEELEASSHYEIYEDGFQVNCLFIKYTDEFCDNINVAFLCKDNILVSICSKKVLPVGEICGKRLPDLDEANVTISILIRLQELKLEKIADLSEDSYLSIEKISKHIFKRENTDLEQSIDLLSQQDDTNGKIRLCLMDAQRDILFLLRKVSIKGETNKLCLNDMLEDIKTLLNHNSFLSERIDFLLNAALGFINIEQNKIIKIFSIAAVVLMPPTVIASIYGMNFHNMPELSWKFGYPLSIFLMIIAGISPYVYFKRKGWL